MTDHPAPRPTRISTPDLPGTRCQASRAGHQVHWVQGLRGANDREHRPEPCRIIAITDDGWITLATDRTTHRLWTHDPEAVRTLARRNQWHGQVQLHWWILQFSAYPGGAAQRCISVAPHPTPCVERPPTGGPLEQLQTHGGFTISAADLPRALSDPADDETCARVTS